MNGAIKKWNPQAVSKTKWQDKKKPYSNRNPMYKQIFGKTSSNFPTGLPNVATVKLNYSTGLALVSTIGNQATYTFRANSIFDPDFTGSGHQPMNFDVWAAQYNHYVVLGSKITCQFAGGAVATPSYVGVQLKSNSPTPHSNVQAMLEEDPNGYKVTNNPRRPIFAVKRFSAKRYFRCTNPNDNKDRIGAAVTQDPAELAYYHVWCAAIDNTVNTTQIVDVKIEYIVQFSEKKPGTFSTI